MNVEDEFSCVSIDGTYKVPMSLVGQPKHGTQKQSFQRSEKHVLETILSKTSCVLDIVPLFSERSSIVIDAVCASLGDKRKYVLVLKADNASNHDNANTFKNLKNLQGICQDPLHRAFEVEAEFGGHRNQLSRTLRSIVHKFSVPCRERNPFYYTYRTEGIDKFHCNSTYDKKLQGMTKRNANALIANIDPESPFRKPSEYFELLAAAVVKHDALVRDRPKLKGIFRNAATVTQFEYLQNNLRFLKKATNIELVHDGTTANERLHFQLLAHFAHVRYQTQRHMKIAVRSFVVRQMMAWYLSTSVKFPYTSSSDQRSGTVLKRLISSVEKQLDNVGEKETAVRKRPASRSRVVLETIATKKRRV